MSTKIYHQLTNLMKFDPIFKETINNLIDSNDAWEIQLTLKLLFMSSNEIVILSTYEIVKFFK